MTDSDYNPWWAERALADMEREHQARQEDKAEAEAFFALRQGNKYRVTTTADSQSPSFLGTYTGPTTLATGETAHLFAVEGRIEGLPPGAEEWYPVVLPREIEKIEEAR
jgi:hypothetical protein